MGALCCMLSTIEFKPLPQTFLRKLLSSKCGVTTDLVYYQVLFPPVPLKHFVLQQKEKAYHISFKKTPRRS